MATTEKFEDIEVWKRARELCKLIHKYTLNDSFAKDFSLKDQIKRSSGSVMDNIAEACLRQGRVSIEEGRRNSYSSYSYQNLLHLKQNHNYIEH